MGQYNELYHHGVKGMRWGVRKSRAERTKDEAERRRGVYNAKIAQRKAAGKSTSRLSAKRDKMQSKADKKETIQRIKQANKDTVKTARNNLKTLSDMNVDLAKKNRKTNIQNAKGVGKVGAAIKGNRELLKARNTRIAAYTSAGRSVAKSEAAKSSTYVNAKDLKKAYSKSTPLIKEMLLDGSRSVSAESRSYYDASKRIRTEYKQSKKK